MNKTEVNQRIRKELDIKEGFHLNLSEEEINEEEYQEIKEYVRRIREEQYGNS